MTTIIHLTDATANERPVLAQSYYVRNENDKAKAIELYTNRYNRVPDTAFVWRNIMIWRWRNETFNK